jgi:hypothetical protein
LVYYVVLVAALAVLFTIALTINGFSLLLLGTLFAVSICSMWLGRGIPFK